MLTKTPLKVEPRVKQFSPFKFVLHQVLRPGFGPPITSLITWCMIECKVDRVAAENAVYDALEYIDVNDLSFQDRDALHLPNLKNRYPTYPDVCKFWKSNIKEPSD